MKAIIIAGGRGERLKPITNSIPKPMVEVDDKPILLHIINHFKKYCIKDFVIATCYLPEIITNFFEDGSKFGVDIKYTFEDPKNPLGTAGAISLARDMIDDTFIVTYADILRELDIKKMLSFHKKNKAFATINVYRRINKDAKSIIVIDNNKKVRDFIERPSQNFNQKHIWSNGAFYILEPEIFNFIPSKKIDFGSEVFPSLLKEKKDIYGFISRGYFIDIGNTEKLEYARQTYKKS